MTFLCMFNEFGLLKVTQLVLSDQRWSQDSHLRVLRLKNSMLFHDRLIPPHILLNEILGFVCTCFLYDSQ